jgi:hypothetical protein
MCDDCSTSIFNFHFICLYCGHITCMSCGEKDFKFKNNVGHVIKTKRNISCKTCSELRRFPTDENPRDCMLPISFIPMDAITHLYELLCYIMANYPEYSIPDRKHQFSLQKYFQQKQLLPPGIILHYDS